MKKIKLLTVFLLVGLSLSAQITKMDLIGEKKHGFGLALSSTASSGISYSYFKDKVGLNATSFFYFENDYALFDLGGMLKYQLLREQNFRVFGYFSSEYKYRSETYIQWGDNITSQQAYVNSGVGVGIDLYTDYFIFHTHFGFGAYRNFEVISMLAGGIGVYYRF